MTLASDNLFPKLILQEAANDGSDFSNPTADYRVLFLGEDGAIHLRDSVGTVTTIASAAVSTINVVIDGGGSAITTGVKLDLMLDFACTIDAWTILADQAGSIVIDIWKDTYANFPPTDADSMCVGKEPTLSAATKAQDLAITDWTTDDVAAGEILRFNVDSAVTVTRVTLALKVTRA